MDLQDTMQGLPVTDLQRTEMCINQPLMAMLKNLLRMAMCTNRLPYISLLLHIVSSLMPSMRLIRAGSILPSR
jgi:hypothetical protein